MLESRTSAKDLHQEVGPQVWEKWVKMARNPPHLWCHYEKPKTQNIFFHCGLEDLPSLM